MGRQFPFHGLTEMTSFDKGLRAILWLNLVDALCTLTWLQMGLATEANPIMNWALQMGPAVFILSKVSLVCLAAALLWRHRDIAGARLALVPVAMLYALIAGTHLGFAMLQSWLAHPVQVALGLGS
jgi:hypothetical protein